MGVSVVLLLLVTLGGSYFFPAVLTASDSQTLLAFRDSVKDPQRSLHRWSTLLPLCQWPGVTCLSGRPTVVATLDCSGAGLQARMENSRLGNLPSLHTLNLSRNAFSGPIPDLLATLPSLTRLDLSRNRFEGAIPLVLGRLRNLAFLDLSHNMLSGSIPLPLKTLPNLRTLVLSNNWMGGLFPDGLCQAPLLETFIMAHNQLVGPFTDDIVDCVNLRILDLQFNIIKGVIHRRVNRLGNLRSLTLASNQLTGPLPVDLTSLLAIHTLDFRNNSINGYLPKNIGQLNLLKNLDLSWNKIEGPIPRGIGNLVQLQELKLSHNDLDGIIPDPLGTLYSLTFIDLSHNRFFRSIPSTLGNLRSLLIMDLSFNSLEGDLPASLGSCESLQELSMSGNQLRGKIPLTWMGMISLTSLDISGNQLSGDLPVAEMGRLSNLDLSRNNLTGEVPLWLLKSVKLKKLNLQENQLTGPIPNTSMAYYHRSAFQGNPGLCGWISNTTCVYPSPPPPPPVLAPPPSSIWLAQMRQLQPFIWVIIALILLASASTYASHIYLVTPDKYEELIDCLGVKLYLPRCFRCPCWRRVGFTFAALKKAAGGFEAGKIIGYGSLYTVYTVEVSKGGGGSFAVKKLKEELGSKAPYLIRQLRIVIGVRHPCVVEIVDWCYNSADGLAVLVQFMPNGSLEYYLLSGDLGQLGWMQRYCIALDAAKGLAYLHRQWWGKFFVVHCKVHPSHVLLDDNFNAHISGLACTKREDDMEELLLDMDGSKAAYTAPEVRQGASMAKEAEVFGYGMILFELLTGKSAGNLMMDGYGGLDMWIRANLDEMKMKIVDPAILQGCDSPSKVLGLLQIAMSCTETDSERRPTMDEVVNMLEKLNKGTFKSDLEQKFSRYEKPVNKIYGFFD